MADRVTIELDDGDMLAAIGRAITRLEKPRQLFEDIGERLESNVNARFDSKTDPNGAPWAPLSAVTRALYDAEDTSADGDLRRAGSLLVRTGQLRASLAFNAGDDFVEVGTSRASKNGRWQIGVLHETGTRKMPRRGLLLGQVNDDFTSGSLGAGDEADVLEIVSGFMGGLFA